MEEILRSILALILTYWMFKGIVLGIKSSYYKIKSLLSFNKSSKFSSELSELKEKSSSFKNLPRLKCKRDENGFIVFWETHRPISITFTSPYDKKRQEYQLYKIAIAPNISAHVYLFCRDENGNAIMVDRGELNSMIYYRSKRVDYMELGSLVGFDDEELEELRYKCRDYYSKIAEIRDNSRTIIYSFSPLTLKFSIFGDYFDPSLPSNHLKYVLLCDGLYGYPDNNEITALSGKDADGSDVLIRLNAIRTMITLEDGKKYGIDDFLELAKTWQVE